MTIEIGQHAFRSDASREAVYIELQGKPRAASKTSGKTKCIVQLIFDTGIQGIQQTPSTGL